MERQGHLDSFLMALENNGQLASAAYQYFLGSKIDRQFEPPARTLLELIANGQLPYVLVIKYLQLRDSVYPYTANLLPDPLESDIRYANCKKIKQLIAHQGHTLVHCIPYAVREQILDFASKAPNNYLLQPNTVGVTRDLPTGELMVGYLNKKPYELLRQMT